MSNDYRVLGWRARVRGQATLANSKGILPRVKDDGWFGSSYQNLSPRREWLNCVAITQAKVGPSMLPGSGRSDTPPDHKSTSEGCLKTTRPGVAVISGDTLFLEAQSAISVRWLSNETRERVWSIGSSVFRRLCRRALYEHARHSLENSAVSSDRLVRHGTEQLLEAVRPGQAAVLPEMIKSWKGRVHIFLLRKKCLAFVVINIYAEIIIGETIFLINVRCIKRSLW